MNKQVVFKSSAHPNPVKHRPYRNSVLAGGLIAAALTGIIWTQTEMTAAGSYLLAMNLTAFLIMGYDKQAAGLAGARTPELVLGLWALLGGTLGCLLGMNLFRHKTKKARFQFIFGAAIIAQILVITQFKQLLPQVSVFKQNESSYSALSQIKGY